MRAQFVTLLAAALLAGCASDHSGGTAPDLAAATCTPACADGQECQNGVCVCDAASCPAGCCMGDRCVALGDESAQACGLGGVACAACGGTTPSCIAGTCTDACGNGASCASGCCSNGACVDGTAASACGAAGACIDCGKSPLGLACVGGGCGCNGDGDCPAGGKCDMTTHRCGACGPSSCPSGCCDPATGACVTASSNACGAAGAMCQACASGQRCNGGACVCDAVSCPNGCCMGNSCVPYASQTATACGTGGASCGGCATGQECKAGVCACDATSCPNGCCTSTGACEPYASQGNGSCGKAGASCGSCAAGTECKSGVCACDANSCANGCCTAAGACEGYAQEGPTSCGTGGAMCAGCASGQRCLNGACVCDATSCPNGCCDASGVCQPGTGTGACGQKGGSCSVCATGQACSAGACVCNGTSCAGCCNGTTCVAVGTESNGQCGSGGASCGGCSNLTPTCAGGSCTAACGAAGDGSCTGGCCNATSGSCGAGTADNACGTNAGSCLDCTTKAIGHKCLAGGVCGCNGNSDCPTGTTCNLTSHTCGSCNATTCPTGCCDANGMCQTGTSTGACGSGGGGCNVCGTGQACSSGACVCNGTSCAGCCSGTSCVAVGNESNGQCGSSGASCASCTGNANGSACVNGSCGCTGAADCAAGSVCTTAGSVCVAGGLCSTGACNGCCDKTGVCVAGTGTTACGGGGKSCTDCVATTPTCDTNATCSGGSCSWSPNTGGTCSTAYCTVGQTCDASGNCTGGTPRDCTGGDVCKSCTCSNATSSCSCSSRTASGTGSSLTTTASCLLLGSNAELAVKLALVDNFGQPITGAASSITFSASGVSWVESGVVESATPGVYYRTMKAPASGTSTTVSASVSWCGSSVAVGTSQIVQLAPAAASTGFGGAQFQGVAGCAPIGGHLRVKVIAGDTGLPLAGASVLVGSAQATPYVTSAAALFPSPSATGANTATTNTSGVAEFTDFGSSLAGAQIVTAGATNYAYVTSYHFNGDDQVLVLPRRRPTPPTTYTWSGTMASPPARTNCTWLQLGVAVADGTLDQWAGFSFGSLFGADKCVTLGSSSAVPSNIYFPSQTVGTATFLCIIGVAQSPWSTPLTAGAHTLAMPFGQVPVSVAQGGNLLTTIKNLNWQSAVYQTVNVSGNNTTDAPTLSETYGHTVTFNFSNTPANTDVFGLSLLDYSGKDGTGAIGLNGLQVHQYSDAGSSVVVPVGTNNTAPAGSRYLGAVAATFMTPYGTRTVPTDETEASTATLVRDNASGMQPFSAAASTTLSVGNFLALAPADLDAAHTTFTFADTTNGGVSPQYSVSTLSVHHTVWQPDQTACQTNAPSKTTTDYTQWVVYRPYAADSTACSALSSAPASCEAFTLPTLPSSFPYATAGTQQQSGFEQYVGSGAACSSSMPCALAGEQCVTPTGTTLPTQCMAQDASTMLYYTEDYAWALAVRGLSSATAISPTSADWTQWKPDMLEESSNLVTWP